MYKNASFPLSSKQRTNIFSWSILTERDLDSSVSVFVPNMSNKPSTNPGPFGTSTAPFFFFTGAAFFAGAAFFFEGAAFEAPLFLKSA